jgi:Domain of unknown function (DUF4136)
VKQMKNLIILLLIAIGAGSASAQKVKVWADSSVNLAKYKTYAWDQPTVTGNPLIGATTMAAVDEALALKGLRKVDSNPELTISMLTTTDSDLYVTSPSSTSNVGTVIPTGIAAGTQRWPITKGTLMVGIADAQTKNSVWRGTATHTLETGPSGSKGYDAKLVEKPIRKAVEKMFKRFPNPK